MLSSRACFLGLAVFLAGCGSDITPAPTPNGGHLTSWLRRVGRSSDAEMIGLAGLAEGGVVMAGRYYGEVDFGGGNLPSPNDNYQAYVAKYDDSGQHIYSKSFGNEFAEAAVDVDALPEGSVIVVGTFNWPVDFGTGIVTPVDTDMFVLKLDPSGKTIWSRRFGGQGEQRPTALAVTSDGGAVLVGSTSGTFDDGLGNAYPTSNDGFVLRIDADGEPVWSSIVESQVWTNISDVAVHPVDGTIAIGGWYNDEMAVGALPKILANGGQDGFVAVYDDKGKPQWLRTVGGPDYSDLVTAIAMAPKEPTIYITGQVMGSVDLGGGVLTASDMYDANTFLLALVTTGGYLGSRLYGQKNSDIGYGLAVDAGSNVYVAGEFYGGLGFGPLSIASKGNSDAFIGRVRPNLEPSYQQGWGDTERQSSYRVVVDGTDRVYVAGSVFGVVDFGLGPTYGSGYYETFLLALPQ